VCCFEPVQQLEPELKNLLLQSILLLLLLLWRPLAAADELQVKLPAGRRYGIHNHTASLIAKHQQSCCVLVPAAASAAAVVLEQHNICSSECGFDG
jgi:hypothetical protein